MLKANEAIDRPVRILFASFDEGLRTLAGLLFPVTDEKPQRERLLDALGVWWKKDQAERITITIDLLYASLDDESRKLRQANSTVSISEMIHRG